MRILLTILTLIATTSVLAGPPKNATKHIMPFPVICTPTIGEMMEALTKDYAVHISMTFEETPENGVIVVKNPDTNTAAILHMNKERTCIVFSGLNMQEFVRPEGMAEPEVDINEEGEGV